MNVFNGEPIVPGRLAPAGTGPGIELKIPPGQRAMAVAINDIAGTPPLMLRAVNGSVRLSAPVTLST